MIYLNDLPHSSSKLAFYLFADDTNIYCEAENLDQLQRVVNKELKKVKVWLDINKLSLNTDKTNFIILSLRKVPPLTLSILELVTFQSKDLLCRISWSSSE